MSVSTNADGGWTLTFDPADLKKEYLKDLEQRHGTIFQDRKLL
jgi:hypothetical protein